jgi:adenylosuccinate lyase
MGVAVGYSLVALKSSQRGLGKLSVNQNKLHNDLNEAWAVLAEPIQTVMRRAGLENPYEQLKAFSRGKALTQTEVTAFIESLPLTEEDKLALLKLTPASYIGLAETLF